MFASTSLTSSAAGEPRDDYAAAVAALAPHTDGFSLDKDRASPARLAAVWRAVREDAESFVRVHPVLTAAPLCGELNGLGADLEAECLQLTPTVVLVAVNRDELGEVFAVNTQGESVWSLTEAPPPSGAAFATLASWRPERASGACRPAHDQPCRALHAKLGRLPDDGAGRPRFYLEASYAQAAGATIGQQLSIWRSTGEGAEPLYVNDYEAYADQPVGVRLEGDRLMVRQKEQYRTFFSCGGCDGRQMDRTIAIDPDGVRDLGLASVAPDADLVDDLLSATLRADPTDALASPQAADALKVILSDAGFTPGEAAGASFGMGSWTEHTDGPARRLDFDLDEAGSLTFTLETRDGRTLVTEVAAAAQP